ncbi:hypothetical protein AnigIFM63604_000504 [Aspergillus niger]|uniref:Uncharacterized protein n=1 Tax=Aspergillus niger TaxID=5061 RepID=A0A9W6E7V5_ASPNG|nr:hypothetical protein AnigIFM63604_000504 [Aspergillus niger]
MDVPSPVGSLLPEVSPWSSLMGGGSQHQDLPVETIEADNEASRNASHMSEDEPPQDPPSDTLEADNEASRSASHMSEDEPPQEYRSPSPCLIRVYEYLGEKYCGQTDAFIIASDASNILKEADPPIPCLLWGFMLENIFEHVHDAFKPLSIDLVIEDEQMTDAIETLRKAGFRDHDNYPGCPYNEGACPGNELKPVHVFHLFDLFSHRAVAETHGVTKGSQQHHDLRLHRKSNVLWRLPKFTVQTEANEADENFMLTLDRRLRWKGVHRPKNKDHPPTKNPLVIPTPARYAEALIYLKARDEHFNICEIDWDVILTEHFGTYLYVAEYGDLFDLDANQKTLSETCREWWEACRTATYTGESSIKARRRLEKELSREFAALYPGRSDEPKPIPFEGHGEQSSRQQMSPSPLFSYSTEEIFPLSESDKALDTEASV